LPSASVAYTGGGIEPPATVVTGVPSPITVLAAGPGYAAVE
jgi:hypothetical protein